jgi:hypothetical protein
VPCWSSAMRTRPGRARWALTQGLEALVYYFDSHPGMLAMARRVIRATLESNQKQLS